MIETYERELAYEMELMGEVARAASLGVGYLCRKPRLQVISHGKLCQAILPELA
jgi:hypothetical protein